MMGTPRRALGATGPESLRDSNPGSADGMPVSLMTELNSPGADVGQLMGILDWEPSESVAFWGKRVVFGFIGGAFWVIESLAAILVVGSVTHTIHPGLQSGQDWTTFLLYLAIWTPLTLMVTYAVRAEWPRVKDSSPRSPRKS